MQKIVAIIPARGGSKEIPGKNLKLLGDKPLVAHSILDAKESLVVDDVFVSTDSQKIAEVSRNFGAKVIIRPKELASDTATSESALEHALNVILEQYYTPDYVVFLQCTSPIRRGLDIDNSIKQIISDKADSLLSVCKSHHFLWGVQDGSPVSINYDYMNRSRRQDLKPQYLENGSIYIFKPWVLQKSGNRLGGKISLFEMDESTSIQIDSEVDFRFCEVLVTDFCFD